MEQSERSDRELRNLHLLKVVEEIEDYAILTLDSSGNIENWNKGAEKIKGYHLTEVIGKNFSIFYSDEDRRIGRPETLIHLATRNGKVAEHGWRLRKDGSRFWGSVVITALYNEDGQVIGFIKMVHDLTSKMLAEKAIKQHVRDLEMKNKELDQFIYIASHDLQEPLLTVQNFVELIEEEYGQGFDSSQAMYFSFIKQSSARMRSLVKSLLDYSRIGRKRVLTDVDCQQILNTVCTDLNNEILVSGAQINYRRMPVIMGYEAELKQLFCNLISNAIKFRKKDVAPLVSISAQSYSDGWRFAVSDNGIGIEPEYIEKVFLIFQRLNTRDAYDGSGIGLAHCKKIVELHNGEISAESVPGEGSTFYFNIEI
jgi:PAS domain S-box-containing protein